MDTTAILVIVVVLPVVGLVFSVMRVLSAYWLKKHLSDQELAAQLSNAFNNSLGAVQQGVSRMIIPPSVAVATSAVPERLQPGVQYVINNAEEALARWPMSPERMAEKIVAREGLKEIETNLAVAGSEAPVAVPPLTPAEVTAETLNRAELDRVTGR